MEGRSSARFMIGKTLKENSSMGMFDYIKCEVPLPDGWEAKELQTKDFDNLMVTHTITKDGKLMLDRGYDEEVALEDRPYPVQQSGSILGPWIGSFKHVSKMEESDFHGWMFFYGSEVVGYEEDKSPNKVWGPGGRPVYKWHEYRAKFTDGRLEKIELVQETLDAESSG